MTTTITMLLLLLGGSVPSNSGHAADPRNYVFFGFERGRIADPAFLNNPSIAGAQIKYSWRQLEPQRDRYNLQPLLEDLALLEKHGKRLFVQLQDVSFSDQVLVPDYLVQDPEFNGGAARQYEFDGDDESNAKFAGWMARRWDPAVRARLIKLVEVLGKELNGRIEGLNFAETAVGFGATGKHHPPGFTFTNYVDGLKEIMSAARTAFPRSCVIMYANFLPGEWLPGNDRGGRDVLREETFTAWVDPTCCRTGARKINTACR